MADVQLVQSSDVAAHMHVAAAPFDPHRPRSAGPLSLAERTLCREAGIPLAFDPVQQGWVTLDCADDFERDDRSVTEALVAELRSRARTELRAHAREARDAERTRATLRALPERLVDEHSEGDAADRLRLLRRLQAEAHALLVERLPDERGRARRRHEALVDGHETTLRPWHEDEAGRFRALLDDPEIWRHLPEEHPSDFDDALARDLIQLSNEGAHHEVRAVKWEGEVVGQARLLFDGAFNESTAGGVDAEISYWFGRAYWGRGLASRVIPLMTLLAFRKRPLASIFARVEEANVASRRALEHAGYVDEGELSCTLRGEPTMRVYRAYRADYLDPEPRDRTRSRARDDAPSTTTGPIARA